MVDRSLVLFGERCVIRYMRYRDTFPAQDFLMALPGAGQARFFALARVFADMGQLPSDTMGHYLDKPYQHIYELKPLKWRIFGFRIGTNLYLCSGAPKRRPKAQEADYIAAENLRVDFINRLPPEKRP